MFARGLAASIAVGALLLACNARPNGKRPNVIIVCIDALRADRLGMYGGKPSVSPNLDRIASEGTVFDQAFSVASWTKPSVPSLLTGLYPSQHGVLSSDSRRTDVLPDTVPTLAESFRGAGFGTAAFVENVHLQRRYSKLDRGFDTYIEDAGDAPELAHRFLAWLDRYNREEPFFAYLHFLDSHWPYTHEEELAPELASAGHLRIIEWGLGTNRFRLLRDAVNNGRATLSAEDLGVLRSLYDADIAFVDSVVGHLVEMLVARGIWEHSIVVVTADHGEGFLDHARLDHGYGPYDEVLRIPLIVRLPGASYSRQRIQDTVQIVDVAPTVLDLAGVTPTLLGGRSLRGLLAGVTGAPDRPVVAEERHGMTMMTALRTPQYKYILVDDRTTEPNDETPGLPSDLAPGERVRMEGVIAGDVFVTDDVRLIERGDPDCELQGPVASLDLAAGEISVLGRRIRVVPGRTRLRRGDRHVELSELAPMSWVRVHGTPSREVFTAEKIEYLGDQMHDIELEGVVGETRTERDGTSWLSLCMLPVLVDADVTWRGFRGPLCSGTRETTPLAPSVTEQLYDLGSDPGERDNIASTHPHLVADLRSELSGIRNELVAHARWNRSTVELDEHTRGKLRALGYLQ